MKPFSAAIMVGLLCGIWFAAGYFNGYNDCQLQLRIEELEADAQESSAGSDSESS